jgi:hypothetical protein
MPHPGAFGTQKHRIFWIMVAGVSAAAMTAGVVAVQVNEHERGGVPGEGSGAITGYVIDSVHYDLNALDPTRIDTVRFVLGNEPPPGATIRIRLQAQGTTWYPCTNTGRAVACGTKSPQARVAPSNELTVLASP